MIVILHGEEKVGVSIGIPSESETAKEIRGLMDHLLTKLVQCGENKRDRDAYDKLLVAYKILVGE